MTMDSKDSEHRFKDVSESGDVERQSMVDATDDNTCSPVYEAVSTSQSIHGSTIGSHAQRQAECQAPVLPTYEQTRISDLTTTSRATDRVAALNASFWPRRLSSMSSVDGSSRWNSNQDATWYLDVVHLALEDAAAQEASGKSGRHISQMSSDPAKCCEHHSVNLQSSAARLASSSAGAAVTGHPGTFRSLRNHQAYLLDAYYEVVRRGDEDLLRQILESGLVTANTINAGFTIDAMKSPSPLMVAVKAGKRNTALILIEYGASVDSWETVQVRQLRSLWGHVRTYCVMRTPLQIAAQEGNLPLVRMLMETYHADDSLISPIDGQTALRLAADAKHQHVVDYLPLRRGGAGLRWRAKWWVAAAKIHRNISYIHQVLQFVLWILRTCINEVAKHILKKTWKALKELPESLPRILHKLRCWIPKVINGLTDAARQTWHGSVRCVKAIPGFCMTLAMSCWSGLCQLWRAVEHIISRSISLIHIAAVAVYTFLYDLTWINLWHSLGDLLAAVFVHLPTTIWHLVRASWTKLVNIVNTLLDWSGGFIRCLACIGCATWLALLFFPKRAFALLVVIGELIGYMVHEIMVWWNPKRTVT